MATACAGGGCAMATAAAAVLGPRRTLSPLLPPPPQPRYSVSRHHISLASTNPSSHLLLSESRRISRLQVRASSEESGPIQADELLADLKGKWDALENKSTVILYGGGAVVAVWLSSIVVGAINSVPLLPKIMELVGLGYTGWFVYRYLLFKSSRKELAEDIEALKKKVAGTGE